MSIIDEMEVKVTPTTGVKCPRCWHYHYVRENYDNLCDRCCRTILDDHPEFNLEVTEGIKIAIEKQKIKYTKINGALI
jgi:hypothetical protein